MINNLLSGLIGAVIGAVVEEGWGVYILNNPISKFIYGRKEETLSKVQVMVFQKM